MALSPTQVPGRPAIQRRDDVVGKREDDGHDKGQRCGDRSHDHDVGEGQHAEQEHGDDGTGRDVNGVLVLRDPVAGKERLFVSKGRRK